MAGEEVPSLWSFLRTLVHTSFIPFTYLARRAPSLMLEETLLEPALHPPASWCCLPIDMFWNSAVHALWSHVHCTAAVLRVGMHGTHWLAAQSADSNRLVKPWSCATGLQNAYCSRPATSTGGWGLKLLPPPTETIKCKRFLIGNCTTLLVNW